jgi:hypothetical protein
MADDREVEGDIWRGNEGAGDNDQFDGVVWIIGAVAHRGTNGVHGGEDMSLGRGVRMKKKLIGGCRNVTWTCRSFLQVHPSPSETESSLRKCSAKKRKNLKKKKIGLVAPQNCVLVKSKNGTLLWMRKKGREQDEQEKENAQIIGNILVVYIFLH